MNQVLGHLMLFGRYPTSRLCYLAFCLHAFIAIGVLVWIHVYPFERENTGCWSCFSIFTLGRRSCSTLLAFLAGRQGLSLFGQSTSRCMRSCTSNALRAHWVLSSCQTNHSELWDHTPALCDSLRSMTMMIYYSYTLSPIPLNTTNASSDSADFYSTATRTRQCFLAYYIHAFGNTFRYPSQQRRCIIRPHSHIS
jgi:hypothetical protein